MDALYNDCYQTYENDMKILEVNPKTFIDQENPQKILDYMKEKALKKVCSVSEIISSFTCVFAWPSKW